ncbi:hypothetical protein [Helicobacter zhangjianzhongii]|uniref:Uncharacterized protein n=1 Tax=Helicobacter zhangjianzhongii TaxID=2974574 RepID=A0ACC6FTX0_9HELI|nr:MULTISPECIES: hypothetical protein [unclassified Helicobacter]MDL0080769.1 hypothetical protein [Helicobacter sp. CPD2-1]MDL0082706.1 hypothetical protein [Helicobacter sp. XJK30-2]
MTLKPFFTLHAFFCHCELCDSKAWQSTSTKNAKRSFFRKVDSSDDYSASAECMDY